jgi:hypothetical protein
MLVLAHSRSLFDKFSGDGKPLAPVDLAVAQTLPAAPTPTAAAIDAVQCKRISVQNKPTRKGGLIVSKTAAPIPQPPETFGRSEILSAGAPVSGQANFAELWDCPVAPRRFD